MILEADSCSLHVLVNKTEHGYKIDEAVRRTSGSSQ